MSEDILKVTGINSKGYGNIPKLVMQDRKLTPEAKCIYSYFASYAGSGNTAFPSVPKIIYDLCMSESRYYRHFKLLTEAGYISVEQVKEVGRFSHNIYILNSEVGPSPQNDGTVPIPQNECTENEGTQNKGTNTNSSKKNSVNKRNYIKKRKPSPLEGTPSTKYDYFYL